MNMDLKGFLLWHKNKSANGIIISNAGHHLTDKEAKAYAKWGIENGYETLNELPEFEEVKKILNELKSK